MRGDREKEKLEEKETETPEEDVEIIDFSRHKSRKIPPPTWRECIKKVWEVDPLNCPYCLGEMKIIFFIHVRL